MERRGSKKISIYIPLDLIKEIVSRLPRKSIARFRCVSKEWESILRRPRLLFALEQGDGELLVYSAPQPHYTNDKSAIVEKAIFHMKFSRDMRPSFCQGITSGLIYFSHMLIPKEGSANEYKEVRRIYNPITGQYVTLPKLKRYRKSFTFLGFDPIDKQHKLLFVAYSSSPDDHRILRLETRKKGWRKNGWRQVQCSLRHEPLKEWICINGVLYYIAQDETYYDGKDENLESYVIVCFDVRSQKFKVVDAKCFFDPQTTKLINYKGKLGGIDLWYDDTDAIKLCVWVLEDVEKQEWSNYNYTLPESQVRVYNFFVVGMMATGEIVLSEKYTSNPFYVHYFNPQKNTLQSVEIQGVGEDHEAFESHCKVYAFVDYGLDSKFITSVS